MKKFIIRLTAIIMVILSFMVLNYITFPYMDKLGDSFLDTALMVVCVLSHIFIPIVLIYIALIHDLDPTEEDY